MLIDLWPQSSSHSDGQTPAQDRTARAECTSRLIGLASDWLLFFFPSELTLVLPFAFSSNTTFEKKRKQPVSHLRVLSRVFSSLNEYVHLGSLIWSIIDCSRLSLRWALTRTLGVGKSEQDQWAKFFIQTDGSFSTMPTLLSYDLLEIQQLKNKPTGLSPANCGHEQFRYFHQRT